MRTVVGLLFRALLAAPRRQFNLPRWTRRRKFRELHHDSVVWLDSHFRLIEQGAPWLSFVGSDVWDFCRGGVDNRFLRLQAGSGAGVGCIRNVTAVYGFDGRLIARLRSLEQALPPVGWQLGTPALPQSWTDLDPGSAATAEGLARHRTRWMTDRRVDLRWSPTAAMEYPPDGAGTPPWGRPPLTPQMRVTWASRGQARSWREDPNKRRPTTRQYLPQEVSELSVPDLLDRALADHEHAFTVTITLAYYSNPNAKVYRHRVPRYLFPSTPLAPAGRSFWWFNSQNLGTRQRPPSRLYGLRR